MVSGRVGAALVVLSAVALGGVAGAEEAEVSHDVLSSASWHAQLSFGGDLRSFDQNSSAPPVSYSGRVPLAFGIEGDYFLWRYLGLALHGDYAAYKLSDFADQPTQPALSVSTYAFELGPELRVPVGPYFSASVFAGYGMARLDAFTFQGGQLEAAAAVRQALATGLQLAWRMKSFGVYARAQVPFAFSASYAGTPASARAWSAGGGVLVRIATLGSAQLAANLSYRYSSEHFEQPGPALAMNETSNALRLGLELEPEAIEPPPAPPPPPPAPPPPPPAPKPEPPKVGFVAGTVLLGQDANAQPVPGASVTVSGAFGERTATTDASGKFRFDDLPPGAASLKAQKSGLKPAEGAALVVAGDNAPTELRLLPEEDQHATLKGLVRNREGAPVAATLLLHPDGRKVTADSEGRFEVRLDPGVQSVVIKADGYLVQRKKVQLKSGETVIFNIELFPAHYR